MKIRILEKLANEIKNSTHLKNQDKDKLLNFIEKTKKTIPLTN